MANKQKNAYLVQLEQSMQDRARIAQYVECRQGIDALILTLGDEEFGFDAAEIVRIISVWIEKRKEIANIVMDDRYGKTNDKHFSFARGKIDHALQSIMGEDYPCHEERYVVDIGKPLFDGGIVIGSGKRREV